MVGTLTDWSLLLFARCHICEPAGSITNIISLSLSVLVMYASPNLQGNIECRDSLIIIHTRSEVFSMGVWGGQGETGPCIASLNTDCVRWVELLLPFSGKLSFQCFTSACCVQQQTIRVIPHLVGRLMDWWEKPERELEVGKRTVCVESMMDHGADWNREREEGLRMG
jgi:hypothetical protein